MPHLRQYVYFSKREAIFAGVRPSQHSPAAAAQSFAQVQSYVATATVACSDGSSPAYGACTKPRGTYWAAPL